MATYDTRSSWEADQSTSSWEETYLADLTAQGTHNFLSTSTKNIEGVTWTVESGANASTLALGASGLTITPTGGDWFQNTSTSPKIYALIKDLVPGLTKRDIVCVQLRTNEFVVKFKWDAAGLAMYNASRLHVSAGRLGDGTSPTEQANSRLLSWSGAHTNVDATPRDFFELIWSGGFLYGAIGNWPGSWPEPKNTAYIGGVVTPMADICTQETTASQVYFNQTHEFTVANMRAAMFSFKVSSPSSLSINFLGIRALKMTGV